MRCYATNNNRFFALPSFPFHGAAHPPNSIAMKCMKVTQYIYYKTYTVKVYLYSLLYTYVVFSDAFELSVCSWKHNTAQSFRQNCDIYGNTVLFRVYKMLLFCDEAILL